MESALEDLMKYRKRNKAFRDIGERMETVWREGIDDLRGHE